MRLLVNTSGLRFGGATQVASSFVHEARRFPEHEYHILLGTGVAQILDQKSFPKNFHFYPCSHGVITLRNVWKIQKRMESLEGQIKPDCSVTTSGPAYWRPRSPHLVGFNRGLFLYNESPYIESLKLRSKVRMWAERRLQCYFFKKEADAYFVQTEDVNRRVRKLFGTELVYTITNTCSAHYDQPVIQPNRLPIRTESTHRLLTVTSFYEHKNLDLIPLILHYLPPNIRQKIEFVLTITEQDFRRFISSKIPPEIKLIGPVPAPECPSLYRECDFMFLPSLAECFSASYPEAMKMEKPIITTDLGFARSICGPAACYFTPKNPKDAAEKIVQVIQDESLQNRLICAGKSQLQNFDSPHARAMKILDLCQSLIHY